MPFDNAKILPETITFIFVSLIFNHKPKADGRLSRFVVAVTDRPGGVARLTKLVSECGASLKDIYHERAVLLSSCLFYSLCLCVRVCAVSIFIR